MEVPHCRERGRGIGGEAWQPLYSLEKSVAPVGSAIPEPRDAGWVMLMHGTLVSGSRLHILALPPLSL